ncbi:WD repeat-containing protein [Teratosphaeria destructans]|uniref:WD repeat-containing protein n=1 Tax=Teratosphaeria destructans TaxID=418781 RepID=A0A9W7W4F0_9PEZI|nr:WD repeat-containing protein [Teratosphaeria destructans]
MEASERIDGLHTTASPCGRLIAYILPGSPRVRISHTHSPQHCTEFNSRILIKDILNLKWSADSSRLAILSSRLVDVLDLDDVNRRIRLDNGSGGLGSFRSADFIGTDTLLTVWEFGNARIWNLHTGKCVDLPDAKTFTTMPAWQVRPNAAKGLPPMLAMLSRQSGEDTLAMQFVGTQAASNFATKVPGDNRTISWSPDGRWLALNGAPYTSPCLHIYTADGHHFKSFDGHDRSVDHAPNRKQEDKLGLIGVKEVVWSPNSQILALSRYDGRLSLLNTRTFGSLADIEHFTAINQSNLAVEDQAPIYEESVAASGERSYIRVAHPFMPPRSEIKDRQGVNDQGVAEMKFSCDGSYLATRDARMQSTVWIWSVATLSARAVLIQHTNVRKLHWHRTDSEVLMIDCGEGIASIYHVSASESPQPQHLSLPGNVSLSWIPLSADVKPAILASTRSTFRVLYPEGRDDNFEIHGARQEPVDAGASFEEGASEDSLMEMLSGRKPLPPLPNDSYTRRIDMEVEEEDEYDTSARLDDTFRGKRKENFGSIEIDPLDDSQIF